MERFDAVTIGSGLGGLTAAAALARTGRRVLVVEKLANIGGAATVYRHGNLTMEASLHETDGATLLGADGPIRRLGLSDVVEGVPTKIFYTVRGGPLEEPVRIPHGLDAAATALRSRFPDRAGRIDGLFARLRDCQSFATSDGPGRGQARGLLGMLLEAPRTAAQSLSRHLGDHEALKCIVGAPIAYFDDDPEKLSALLYLSVWAAYTETGSYYIRGGSRSLSLALARVIKDAGGQVRTRCRVDGVMLAPGGEAVGIVYTDHLGARHEALAPVIFGNAAPFALADLVPGPARQRLLARDARYEPSISLFVVSLGLSRPASDFGIDSFSTFVYPKGFTRFTDYPSAAARFGAEPGGALPPYVIADYGRLDTGLRQEGDQHLLTLTGVDNLSWWLKLGEAEEKERRQRWIEALIADLERSYPGLAGAVMHAEMANARTMRSRLGTPRGEVYGYRPTPRRFFARPPGPKSPVKGLYYASAYTVSGGYAGAMRGGLMAADAVLGQTRSP